MRIQHYIFYSILSLFISNSYAFDLIEAWQAATTYNATYSAAMHQKAAGQEKAVQGRSQLLPQISANASYNFNNTIRPQQDSDYETHDWGLRITQPLFDVTKYANYRRGAIEAQLADTEFGIAVQKLMLETAQSYFDLLLAHDTLEATRAAKTAYARQLDQAKASFERGTATIVDTYEAQANYDGAAAKEITAQTDLEVKGNALRKLTGLNPVHIQRLDGNKVFVNKEGSSLEDWQNIALENSLDVRGKTQSVELATQNLLAQQGERLPKIQFTAGYSSNINNSDNARRNDQRTLRGSNVSVELNIPLFAGGGLRSQVREAAEKRLQAKDELEAGHRQVKEEVREAYLGVTSGESEIRATEQLLASVKSKLNATRLGKSVGVRTNLDLLEAEKEYYETIRKLAEVRYRYLLYRLKLAQAAGLLELPILVIVNQSIKHSEPRAREIKKTGYIHQTNICRKK